MTDKPLLMECRDGGAHVTFNRPEVRNAITRDMLAELADFLSAINDDPKVRYLVFRGTGEHFTAGGDVGGFEDSLQLTPHERRRAYERRLIANSDPFLLLGKVVVPVISITRGAVAGAGMAFALASDFVLSAQDSFFVFAHAKLGLPLDMSVSYYLPRVVGWRQAKSLTLASARLTAQRAMELGIVNEVLPKDLLDERAAELIAELTAGPREAFCLTKALLDASLTNTLATQLDMEKNAVGLAVAHPDFTEGVSAFLQRRKPSFRSAE